MVKNITANGEFVFVLVPETANTDVYPKLGLVDAYWPIRGEEYNEENYLSVIIPQGNYETIGYCSEIIKDEELAKMVVKQSIHTGLFMHHNGINNVYCYEEATEAFEHFLVSNDIDLEVGDWLVIKKV